MRYFLIGFITSLFLQNPPQSIGKEEDRLFYDAVRAEASGDIISAINFYKAASEHSHSANLHGNLANLYFKTEDYGRSILHYRKALFLSPSNREFSENLNFAHEVAGLSSSKKEESIYFAPSSRNYWVIFSFFLFWVGLAFLSLFYYLGWMIKKILPFLILWLIIFIFSIWGVNSSQDNLALLKLEVIALKDIANDRNQSKSGIELRRFAGQGSSANTKVKGGESLFLSIGENNLIKSHKSEDGESWYLARTGDSRKKGWVGKSEIGWVLGSPEKN